MKLICKELYRNSRFNTTEIIRLIYDSFSKEHHIRVRVAQNQNIPIFVLERMSRDKSESVRHFISRNRNTPISTLKRLSKEKSDYVSKSAFINLAYRLGTHIKS